MGNNITRENALAWSNKLKKITDDKAIELNNIIMEKYDNATISCFVQGCCVKLQFLSEKNVDERKFTGVSISLIHIYNAHVPEDCYDVEIMLTGETNGLAYVEDEILGYENGNYKKFSYEEGENRRIFFSELDKLRELSI